MAWENVADEMKRKSEMKIFRIAAVKLLHQTMFTF